MLRDGFLAEYCFGLKELILPNVSEIREGYLPFGSILGNYGSWTFVGCYNLESLCAPKVIEIKENTFSGFKKLNNIEINWQKLHSIGEYAFEYCSALDMDITLDKLVRSTLSSIDEVLLDMRDITGDSKLEIRFENLSITFDGRDMYDIKASGAQIFSLTKDFNYTAKKYNGYSRVWSCKIEVMIDGFQIKDFDSGVSIRLNGSLDDKSDLYLGGNTINFTREDSDTISFSSNRLGVFLYGEKLDYQNVIVSTIIAVAVLVCVAGLIVYFVYRKKTRKE